MITAEISSATAIAAVTAVRVRTSGPADIGLLQGIEAAGRQVAAGGFPAGRAGAARAAGEISPRPPRRPRPDPVRAGRRGIGDPDRVPHEGRDVSWS